MFRDAQQKVVSGFLATLCGSNLFRNHWTLIAKGSLLHLRRVRPVESQFNRHCGLDLM
jgi:hypothetical protein